MNIVLASEAFDAEPLAPPPQDLATLREENESLRGKIEDMEIVRDCDTREIGELLEKVETLRADAEIGALMRQVRDGSWLGLQGQMWRANRRDWDEPRHQYRTWSFDSKDLARLLRELVEAESEGQ